MILEKATQRSFQKKASAVGETLPALPPKLAALLSLLLLIVFAIVLFARFATRGDLYLSYFEDDYFYYLVVAKNIVLHGMSSFDGIRPTNGYQPLWQLVNTALYWIFGDHRSFFIVLLLLVFAFVIGTYRTLRQIWNWYLYPLVPIAALLGPAGLSQWKPLRRPIAITGLTVAAGCLSILTIAGMLAPNPTERALYQQAEELQEFSQSHPGRYAMGGGSGVPGYVMTSTLVQVEGLMGDAAFLDRIKRKEPLVQALQELGVDYYATMLLRGPPQTGPCYNLREPEMAGFQSPVMAGRLCAPVADFVNYGGRHMLIFDVRRVATANVSK